MDTEVLLPRGFWRECERPLLLLLCMLRLLLEEELTYDLGEEIKSEYLGLDFDRPRLLALPL